MDTTAATVAVVGPVGAGKTSLVQRIAYGAALGSDSTVGAIAYRSEQLPGVCIFDTPGDDKYVWAYEPLLKRASAIVYCEPPGSAFTRDYAQLAPHAVLLTVRTKADTIQRRRAESADAVTSALSGEGVDALVELLRDAAAHAHDTQPPPLRLQPKTAKKRGLCG